MPVLSKLLAFARGRLSGRKKAAGTSARTFLDVPYGSDCRELLDLMLPENASGETGLVLCVHGGAWIIGSKDDYRGYLREMVSRGYAAAALSYRYVSDTTDMSVLMDEITAALAKIRSTAAENGVTLNKVLLAGASAGAQMALLYAYKHAAAAPITPVAVISNSGPADLIGRAFIERNGMGGVDYMVELMSRLAGVAISAEEYLNKSGRYGEWIEALRSYSPLYFVGGGSVPTLIAHGVKDDIVPFDGAAALDAALTANGVPHEFTVFPSSGHALDGDPGSSARAEELTRSYAEKYLG